MEQSQQKENDRSASRCTHPSRDELNRMQPRQSSQKNSFRIPLLADRLHRPGINWLDRFICNPCASYSQAQSIIFAGPVQHMCAAYLRVLRSMVAGPVQHSCNDICRSCAASLQALCQPICNLRAAYLQALRTFANDV